MNDPNEKIVFSKYITVRNKHAIVNAVKILKCLKCHCITPGFDIPFTMIPVLEGRKKFYIKSDHTSMSLTKSDVLKTSIELSQTFQSANGCISTPTFATGVCVKCSGYYHVDKDTNNIVPNVNYPAFVQACRADLHNTDEENNENDEIRDFDRTKINLYSDENLVSTCIWNDNAYKQFVKTLSEAEKMVMTSLHVQVTVLRLRSNNIPFSKHGAICLSLIHI